MAARGARDAVSDGVHSRPGFFCFAPCTRMGTAAGAHRGKHVSHHSVMAHDKGARFFAAAGSAAPPGAAQTNTARGTGSGALATGTGLPSFLQRRIEFREAGASGAGDPSDSMYALRATPERASRPDDRKLPPLPLSWAQVVPVGPGLANMGNTCFLNSVLQCLTHTPPLAHYLLSGAHSRRCPSARAQVRDGRAPFCALCELERHVQAALGPRRTPGARSISPGGIVGHLRHIARHMYVGRQEDAHEFLRFTIDAMGRSPGAGPIVDAVFGGELVSEVRCLACGRKSATREPFLDISLDVRVGHSGDATTLDAGFAHFARTERLHGANRYRCEASGGGCGALADAEKRLYFARAPRVLTVHLKRFAVSAFGVATKISRDVEFGARLDVSRHCAPGVPAAYSLYAVLVHEGQTCTSGHYHAFVRAPNDAWYSMNDSSVHGVPLSVVLKQRAYLLFYVRDAEDSPAQAEVDVTPTGDESGERPAKRSRPANQRAEGDLARGPASPGAGDERPIVAKSMWHRTARAEFALSSFDEAREPAPRRPSPSWHVRPTDP